MSGVRQKERFSLGALSPSEIIKGISRGKLEGKCRVYSVKLIVYS
jgi:hypothetical protein